MFSNFTKQGLYIGLKRNLDETLTIEVSSDYANSSRKSRIYVNEDKIRLEVEKFWKSVRTKKLLSMRVFFDEIDYYDNDIAPYETPNFMIERGLKKAKISHNSHGSVPKDWGFVTIFNMENTSTQTPILEIIENLLGRNFETNTKVLFLKKLKPILQKKENYLNFSVDYE
jgi:hypothetical protein